MKRSKVRAGSSSNQVAISPWDEDGDHPQRASTGLTHRAGFTPYATMQIRNSHHLKESSIPDRQIIREIVSSPYTRIKRIEKMIIAQKRQSMHNNPTQIPQTNTLKPHFKVKSLKNTSRKQESQLSYYQTQKKELHIQNLILDNIKHSSRQSQSTESTFFPNNINNSKGFMQNFKNRCKLQRRGQKLNQQMTLVQMLNRLSQNIPTQRFKSRAFASAHRVAPLSPDY